MPQLRVVILVDALPEAEPEWRQSNHQHCERDGLASRLKVFRVPLWQREPALSILRHPRHEACEVGGVDQWLWHACEDIAEEEIFEADMPKR